MAYGHSLIVAFHPGAMIATRHVSRSTTLAAFSRKQTPRVIALENAAEQLRRNLSGGDIAWSALRQWKLNDGEKRGYSPIEIAQVMRSYAYYQNGLLPAQRRLLREISIELQMAGDSTANATAAQPYLFFPPEPARVLMPDDASAEIAAKFAAYQTKKSQLKKELYDAVYAHDGVRLGFLRGNSLATLAEKQNARLNELETLAEEIRRGLAQVTEPTRVTERSPLPPLLQGRVDRLITSYLAKQREAGARIDTLIQEGKDLPMQATYRFESDSLKYMVIPSGGGRGRGGRGGPGGPGGRGGSSRGAPSPEASARVDELRANIGVIADDYGRFMAEVINEKNAIRKEIADIMGNAKADAIDNALLAALRVATARDTEDSYRDYRVAVFQPGLSPEQRRLLFDRVIEGLNLPLPSGELQPSVRASSW